VPALQDRVAIVTGASGAIGSDVVTRLARAGATVVAVDVRPPATETRTGSDGAIIPVALDVTDAPAVSRAVADLADRLERIDILVNAAGVFGDMTRTDRIDTATWDRYVKVNLSGPFYMIRAVLPHMVSRQWGRIVNFSSISATKGGYKQAHYASAKAGLIGLTRSIALEFAPAGLTCNAVLPGPIVTPALSQAPPDVIEAARGRIPAGRLGTISEVAAVVAFLVDPEAGYVNGVSIPVDGGAMLLQFRFARRSRHDRPPAG
jgi:acetoacetyl-CoA reductase